MNDIIVELHDGQKFEYDSDKHDAAHIVDDLKAKGVTRQLVKNTWHIIPSGVINRELKKAGL